MLVSLSDSDAKHLLAAEGWLALNDHVAANDELENITPLFRVHPDVLGVRWHIYSRAKKWDAAFEIARFLTEQLPDDAFGWIHQSALVQLSQATPLKKLSWAPEQRLSPQTAWFVRGNLNCCAPSRTRSIVRSRRSYVDTEIEIQVFGLMTVIRIFWNCRIHSKISDFVVMVYKARRLALCLFPITCELGHVASRRCRRSRLHFRNRWDNAALV